jgi:dCMP deaminase
VASSSAAPRRRARAVIIDDEKDRNFLRVCYHYAARYSTDPRTWNAAALVRGNQVLALAANGLPDGVRPEPDRLKKPLKALYMVHAEEAVILKAAREGKATEGSTLYAAWTICTECAKAAINAGVREVVGHAAPFHKSRPEWEDSIRAAEAMLEEAGVAYRLADCQIRDVSIRFDDRVVWP